MKVKARVVGVEEGHVLLNIGQGQASFPVDSLPGVSVGDTISIKVKVEHGGTKEKEEETLEVMSSILDRSCPRD